MLTVLLKMIPFRDYVYAALGIAAVLWYNVHTHNLEVAYGKKQVHAVELAVADASQKAQDAAKKLADEKERQYALQATQVEDTYEKQIKSADAQHTRDLERVRQLTAQVHSNTSPMLPSTGGTAPGPDVGPGRADALGAGAELADALRRDDAQLTQCWADRDSLTGK
jgi:hypothetical protein